MAEAEKRYKIIAGLDSILILPVLNRISGRFRGYMQKNRLKSYPVKNRQKLKLYLDELNDCIESHDYIHSDPVQFMHAFSDKRDKEIAGFFAALMAWGRRDIICNKVEDLLNRMEYQPFEFVNNYSPSAATCLTGFKHRTFKSADIHGLLSALHIIYQSHKDFESFWEECQRVARNQNRELIAVFHQQFLQLSPEMELRTHKHISSPEKKSSCKRLYMYLRWCVRKESPVDSGIWSFLSPADLKIPLDVHVSRQARKMGLLTRANSDWRAVNELTGTLKEFDPYDPVRYDYALFGLGIMDFSIPDHLIVNKGVT